MKISDHVDLSNKTILFQAEREIRSREPMIYFMFLFVLPVCMMLFSGSQLSDSYQAYHAYTILSDAFQEDVSNRFMAMGELIMWSAFIGFSLYMLLGGFCMFLRLRKSGPDSQIYIVEEGFIYSTYKSDFAIKLSWYTVDFDEISSVVMYRKQISDVDLGDMLDIVLKKNLERKFLCRRADYDVKTIVAILQSKNIEVIDKRG